MDLGTNTRPQVAAPGHPAGPGTVKKNKDSGKMSRVGVVAAIAAVVILLIALVVLVAVGNNDTSGSGEDKYVDTSKLQAVFLNTGQVYFGKITTLNDKYFVVKNIYYLQTSSGTATTTTAAANTSVSLVKLGCELHEPYDQMVINRDQVTFWENLQSNGQVAKAVATFQQQILTVRSVAIKAQALALPPIASKTLVLLLLQPTLPQLPNRSLASASSPGYVKTPYIAKIGVFLLYNRKHHAKREASITFN